MYFPAKMFGSTILLRIFFSNVTTILFYSFQLFESIRLRTNNWIPSKTSLRLTRPRQQHTGRRISYTTDVTMFPCTYFRDKCMHMFLLIRLLLTFENAPVLLMTTIGEFLWWISITVINEFTTKHRTYLSSKLRRDIATGSTRRPKLVYNDT